MLERRPSIAIALSLVATTALAVLFTAFAPPNVVLGQSSWGAGTPSSSGITAFATFGPWWREHKPEAIVTRPGGGIEPAVAIPRDEIKVARHLEPPLRGVGYDAFLGAITAIRSLFSPSLVFDFPLMLRVQHVLLVAALALLPVILWLALPDRRSPWLFVVYTVCFLAVMLAWPNRQKFLTEGIVDSAIANALALFGVGALVVVERAATARSRRAIVALVAASLLLGFCPLVRGEFLPALLLVYLFLVAVIVPRDRKAAGLVVASLAIAVAPTIALAGINKAVFGHFAPRVQAGQNLFEPIGQFPNPYGIEYSDVWFEAHVRERGFDYPSFEGDAYATRRYFEILRESPGLLWSNFNARLATMRGFFKLPIHVVTLALGLAAAVYLSLRRPRLTPIFIPLVFAIGFVAFLAWTHDLTRAITPIHFLANAFLCFLLADFVTGRVLARRG